MPCFLLLGWGARADLGLLARDTAGAAAVRGLEVRADAGRALAGGEGCGVLLRRECAAVRARIRVMQAAVGVGVVPMVAALASNSCP